MGVHIFAVTDDLTSDEPRAHRAELTRDEARLVVDAIVALPDADDVAWPTFVDDDQCGWYAGGVHPDRLAGILAGLGGGLVGKTAALMERAVRERWKLTVEDGTEHLRTPCIMLGVEKVDEVSAQLCAWNAREAFRRVGYDFDSSEGMDVPAAELADRCAGHVDHHVVCIGRVAAYAIKVAGPHAVVRAA